MHRNIMTLALLVLGLVLTGCDDNQQPPKTTIVKLAQPQVVGSIQNQELGSGIKIKFITPKESSDAGGHGQMQVEVQRQMELFINDGRNEIVRVVTTRCNGKHYGYANDSNVHLLSAEIYYRPKK